MASDILGIVTILPWEYIYSPKVSRLSIAFAIVGTLYLEAALSLTAGLIRHVPAI
jgi:hypothetical protein